MTFASIILPSFRMIISWALTANINPENANMVAKMKRFLKFLIKTSLRGTLFFLNFHQIIGKKYRKLSNESFILINIALVEYCCQAISTLYWLVERGKPTLLA
jgi:hypothetical protein